MRGLFILGISNLALVLGGCSASDDPKPAEQPTETRMERINRESAEGVARRDAIREAIANGTNDALEKKGTIAGKPLVPDKYEGPPPAEPAE